MNWYAFFNRVLVGPFIRRRVRVTVVGRENLPVAGACILAMGSHTTEVESLLVAAALRERQLHFYAKIEYWRGSGLKGRLQRWFMNSVGHIPVERGEGRAALKAIKAGVEVLRCGEVLAVYPEGTRVSDGKVHAAYQGTVRTLLTAIYAEYKATDIVPCISIIPVGLLHMGSVASPKGGFMPRRGEVEVRIGKPIRLSFMEESALRGGRPTPRLTQELTTYMMRRIADLCGKEYDSNRLPIPGSR